MLLIPPTSKIYLAIQAIDFRKGIDGFRALCEQQFSLDPFSGHYFIFRNKKASAIKILVYDSQGFWLCQKRLSKGYFHHWPKNPHALVTLNSAQLQVLLQNGDPSLVHIDPPWRSY